MIVCTEMLLENLVAAEQAKEEPSHQGRLVMSEAAFEAFYHETARPLWSYVCRVCGDSVLTDDVVQETYLRFLRCPGLKSDRSLLKAYLYKIATNLITDHWRRSAREQRSITESHSSDAFHQKPSAVKDTPEDRILLRRDLSRVFQRLRPTERSLLWLAYVEGSEHREIAAVLGIKEKSIRVLLFRARQKLLALLKRRGLSREVKL
jgi:RNA polymerase sigma-70 factor, ECF subfamily